MFRSILAILVGYLSIVVTTIIATILLCVAFGYPLNASATTPKPSIGFSTANLVASATCAAIGGLMTASIARRSRRLHTLILGVIVLVLGLTYAVFEKNSPEPQWYLVVLPVVGAIAVIAGGLLRAEAAEQTALVGS